MVFHARFRAGTRFLAGGTVAAVLVTLVSACGGRTAYTEAKTRACLDERGARTSSHVDFIATTATGGAFTANLGDNSVKVMFGRDQRDAQAIVAAYERFAFANVRAGLPDVLRRYSNAVTLWHEHPQDADLSLVIGCLR